MRNTEDILSLRWQRYKQSRIREYQEKYDAAQSLAADMQKAEFEMMAWPWARTAERIVDPKELLERRLKRGRDLAIMQHHIPEWPLSEEQQQIMQEYLDTREAENDPALRPLPPLDDSPRKRSFFSRRKRT